MKRKLTLGAISLLLCSLLGALLIGLSSEYFKVYNIENGQYTIRTYVKSVIVIWIYILVGGYWLLYIPFLMLFWRILEAFPVKSHLIYGLLGGLIGFVGCCIYLLWQGDLTALTLVSFPTKEVLVTAPTYGVVGAIYGIAYRQWQHPVDYS